MPTFVPQQFVIRFADSLLFGPIFRRNPGLPVGGLVLKYRQSMGSRLSFGSFGRLNFLSLNQMLTLFPRVAPGVD